MTSFKYASNEDKDVLLIIIDKQNSLPFEIGQLTNLVKLSLYENNLTSLPPEIGQLTNLTELNLRDNNFSPAERTRIRELLPDCEIEF